MKYLKLVIVAIIACALTNTVKAQYCNFFAMSEGSVLGYQNLNARGKVTSYSKTSCYGVSTDSKGVITYKVKTEISNAKGINVSSREYEMKCEDGHFFIDTESYADPNAIEGFQKLAVDINTRDVTYPKELAVGQVLPDAIIELEASAENSSKNTYVILITNRKIVSTESITVPVGTFDCFKITYDLEMKSSTSSTYEVIEYLSEGVGKIKTETYNYKGKLDSSTLLVELSK